MRISEVRQDAPMILCITNDVVKNFTANGLLALGASPLMAIDEAELDELIAHSGAVLINIGTLSHAVMPAIKTAIASANMHHVPVVLDPVACGATAFRKTFTLELLEDYRISVIRGNASEISSLTSDVQMKGTDSAALDTRTVAKRAGETYDASIIVTGEVDSIYSEGKLFELKNGTEMLTKVTGGGCLLGAIVSAFIYNEEEPKLSHLIEAVSYYNIAAEFAARCDNGTLPGHFQINLLDMLNLIGENEIAENMRVEEVN